MPNALMVKNLNKMILNDFSTEDFQLSISNIITPMMEVMGQFVLSFVVNLDMMATRNGTFKSWFLRRLTGVRSRFYLSGSVWKIMVQGSIDDDRFKSMNRYNDLEVNSISVALGYYVIDERNEEKHIFQYLGEPCTNIDECALNTHNCTIDRSTCQDTEGSYFCPCKLGWVSDINKVVFKIFVISK